LAPLRATKSTARTLLKELDGELPAHPIPEQCSDRSRRFFAPCHVYVDPAAITSMVNQPEQTVAVTRQDMRPQMGDSDQCLAAENITKIVIWSARAEWIDKCSTVFVVADLPV